MKKMIIFGYVYKGGKHGQAIRLEGQYAIIAFIKKYLFAEELRLCDASDHLIFHALDGVDIYNNLDNIGIDLPAIYRAVLKEETKLVVDAKPKETWEKLYDQIGLSPGEIAMRQRVKIAAKAASSVSEVAELVQDTYFDAFFYTLDESKSWGYFDGTDFTVSKLVKVEDAFGTGWQSTGHRVHLSSKARVKHRSSSEDVHRFILLNPPKE